MENYLVVLFKNKKKKKIIKKFITYKKCKEFYNKKMNQSDSTIFDVQFENGEDCTYELAIISLSKKIDFPTYKVDEFGRQIKVVLENEDKEIVELRHFKKEETIFDLQKNIKISVPDLIKKYLSGDGIKLVSSLNNKIIVQKDINYYLFSLKNENEPERLIDSLTKHFMEIKKGDCIFVKDVSSAQRKYLFNLLEERGVDKRILYRKFTTNPPSK